MNFIFVQKDAAFNATFLVVKYSSKVQSTEIDCELKAIVKERRSTPVGYIQNALAEFLCGPYFRETGEKTDNVNFFPSPSPSPYHRLYFPRDKNTHRYLAQLEIIYSLFHLDCILWYPRATLSGERAWTDHCTGKKQTFSYNDWKIFLTCLFITLNNK